MLAPVTFNNEKMYALYDTGADTSIIGYDCLKELLNKDKRLKVDYTDVLELNVVGGGKVKSLGSVMLNVLVISRTIKHKFYIMDGNKNILGMDIMDLLHVKVNTRKRIIKIGNGKKGKIMNLYQSKSVESKIKIRCKEDIILDSRSITSIPVVVENKNVSTLLFEPLKMFNESCPRALINVRDGVSTICLLNSTERNIKFLKGDMLGYGNVDYKVVDQLNSGSNHYVNKEFREDKKLKNEVHNLIRDEINNVEKMEFPKNEQSNRTSITEEVKKQVMKKIEGRKDLTKTQQKQMNELLMEFYDVFNDKLRRAGMVDKFPCNIQTYSRHSTCIFKKL